jgi:hypothetical protein
MTGGPHNAVSKGVRRASALLLLAKKSADAAALAIGATAQSA